MNKKVYFILEYADLKQKLYLHLIFPVLLLTGRQ